MDYVYRFPVVRGIQAEKEYYIGMVPLKMLTRLFPADEEYVPPEFRAQRKLNEDINDSELFSEFSRILNIVRDFTT